MTTIDRVLILSSIKIKIIRDHGSNISDNTLADQFTYFAIVYAPYRNNWLSTVKTLIEKQNVDIKSVDSNGYSALHEACW